MAISLQSITRGKARKAPRSLLIGVQKIGKSTFAAGAPKPIFIPIKREEGLDNIDCASFPACGSYEAVIECLTSLATEQHDFGTVVIDSASALEPLVQERTCQEHKVASIERVLGGYGKGFGEALKWWREIQSAVDYLRDVKGMGAILIGHTKVKTFNDPLTDPYDQYQLDLQKDAAAMFERWADCILFANFEAYTKSAAMGEQKAQTGAKATVTHAVGTSARYLYTEKRPAHPGGCRYALPYKLDFTYAAFQAAFDAATDKPETAAA